MTLKEHKEIEAETIRIMRLVSECLDMNNIPASMGATACLNVFLNISAHVGVTNKELKEVLDLCMKKFKKERKNSCTES